MLKYTFVAKVILFYVIFSFVSKQSFAIKSITIIPVGTTVCVGSSITFNYSSVDLGSDLNYDIMLSTSSGTFPGTDVGDISLVDFAISVPFSVTIPFSITIGSVNYKIQLISKSSSAFPSNISSSIAIPIPLVTNSATASTCSGTGPNITLTSDIPSTFSWTIGNITGGITGAIAGSGGTINQVLTNPSNASAGTVQYIVTPTSVSGLCVGNSFTITVTVNPKPIVTNSATVSKCSGVGTNINLTSSTPSTFSWTIGTITGSITGASAGSGGSINQVLTNQSNATTGTVQYIVTPTSTAGCTGAPFTITVTVNPTPLVTNSPTVTICSGLGININLTASTAITTFSWTIGTITGGITGASAGSGGTINQVLTNPNTTAGSVQYIVTPTSSAGCTGPPFTITVTVNPVPVITNSPTFSTCSGIGFNIPLTSSIVSTFSWTIGTITGGITGASAGSGGTINQVLTNPSNTTAGTVQYLIQATSQSNSCIGLFTITVTVNPTPLVTNSTTASTCSGVGTNINLTSSTPSTFSWTIGTITGNITGASASSGGTINQVLTNPNNATAGTVQYIITPISSAGCTGPSFPITVTVNPAPLVTNSATASTCSGIAFNIILTSTIPSTFSWTIGPIIGNITGANAGSGGTINQVLTNPSNTTAGTVQYLIQATSQSNSCIGFFTITVTVNPTPLVTNSTTASTCSGVGTNINLTSSTPSTFSWSIGTITGNITGATSGSGSTINQVLTNPSNSTSGTVQYIVTPTSTAGCIGPPFTITVTVHPTPLVTNASTVTICSGLGPNIPLTSSTPSTFSWTIGTIVGGITGASASSGGTINQVLTNPNTTDGSVQYIVTPTSSAGCTGPLFTITVTVNPAPLITNSPTFSTCSDIGFNIPLTSNILSTFSWIIGTTTGSITGASDDAGTAINQVLTNPSNATSGTVQYIVTPVSTLGCTGSSFTITVTVNPTPEVTNSPTVTMCSGLGPNIILTSSTPSTFSWTIGAITGGITGASASSGGIINQVLTNPSNTTSGTVQYIVTPISLAGCTGPSFSITVTVNPAPLVTNLPTVSICSGSGPNITLTSSISSAFSWTIGTITGNITGASPGSGTTINQILTNPSNTTSGTVPYIVTPTSTASCPGPSFTITVIVEPTPIVTNLPTDTICSGLAPNITLTSSTSSTFSWTIGPINGGITGSSSSSGAIINQVLTNPSNSSTGSVQYIVTPFSTAGCPGPSFTITVIVEPTPLVTNLPSYTICSGLGPNIALTSSTSSTFSWTIGSITGDITGASSGSDDIIDQELTNPSNTSVGIVEYIVTPTSTTNACEGQSFTITVYVNPLPYIPLFVSPNNLNEIDICENQFGLFFSVQKENNIKYHWEADLAGIPYTKISNEDGLNNAVFFLHHLSSLTCTIDVTAIDATSGCQSVSEFIVNILPGSDVDTSIVALFDPVNSILGCGSYINVTGYQWGFNNKVTMKDSILEPEINQVYIAGSSFDTTNLLYWVEVEGADGCISRSYYNQPDTLHTKGNYPSSSQTTALLIYPNPSFGNFTIELPPNRGIAYQVSITDIFGKIQYYENLPQNVTSYNIDTKSRLSKGIYIVKAADNKGKSFTGKLIIQ